jgi:hypothetical protein
VLLGAGIPAFPVAGMTDLNLVQSRQFGNGNMLLSYRIAPVQHADAA